MSVRVLEGDCRDVLKTLPDQSVHCVVTSPPYFGLRDYGVAGQIGLEPTPAEFVAEMVAVFREVRRVLRDDGTLWLNLGDSYAGSGRGGNPEAGTKQGTNKGSQTVGVLYGREESAEDERARVKAQFAAERASGLKPKDLIGIPWRTAFALQADGWYLRQDIVWSKPNPMPESVQDRCTKAHEYIFMLSKSARYHYDGEAIKEPMSMSSVERLSQDVAAQRGSDRVPGKTNGTMKAVGKIDKQRGHSRRHAGFNDRWDAMERAEQCSGTRNKRSVWEVATAPFSEAHFATFPPALIEPCIKAGCPIGGMVLDPFGGAGTTGLVADRLQRNAILIELNPAYAEMGRKRIRNEAGMFGEVA
jgi:DNA modification methylase